MSTTASALDAAGLQHFIEHGWIRLEACFSKAQADELVDAAFAHDGVRRDDPATWPRPLDRGFGRGASHAGVPVREFAPRAWAATCQLLGGEARLGRTWAPSWGIPDCRQEPLDYRWGPRFIVNFSLGAHLTWEPPPARSEDLGARYPDGTQKPGYHVDGNWFRHFLDSPEQALMTVVLWDEVLPRGGATFIAQDSLPQTCGLLRDHPEGVERGVMRRCVDRCSDFVECTGGPGDVYLMHPKMLHNSSLNSVGRPRIISNPVVALREPFCFDREDSDDLSPVERCTLHALGCSSLDFRPTAPRAFFDQGR
jgi:hypothetical protein